MTSTTLKNISLYSATLLLVTAMQPALSCAPSLEMKMRMKKLEDSAIKKPETSESKNNAAAVNPTIPANAIPTKLQPKTTQELNQAPSSTQY